MKKISTLALAALFILPVTLMAADEGTANDSSSTAAVYQQPAGVADSAATPAQPAAAADSAEQGPSPSSAVSQNPVAVPAKPAESMEIFNILSRTVDGLSQQLVNVRADVAEMQQQNGQLRQQITKMQFTIYGLAVVVVLLALLSLVRSRKNSAKPAPAPIIPVAVTGSTQGEYDFMGSSEAIPAKLDLARAYIAMEDFASARETLIEILTEGGEEHRLEAKSLLNKIKQ